MDDKVDIQILANIRSHIGKKVSVVFRRRGKIIAKNGIIGHIKEEGLNLLIDGLIHNLIPFFKNGNQCIYDIYDTHNFDLMTTHLKEPMSFKMREKESGKYIIKQLKKYFNKNIYVVFKKDNYFYVRHGKLLDMGLQVLILKTSYFEKVNCDYRSIYNIFDNEFSDILKD